MPVVSVAPATDAPSAPAAPALPREVVKRDGRRHGRSEDRDEGARGEAKRAAASGHGAQFYRAPVACHVPRFDMKNRG